MKKTRYISITPMVFMLIIAGIIIALVVIKHINRKVPNTGMQINTVNSKSGTSPHVSGKTVIPPDIKTLSNLKEGSKCPYMKTKNSDSIPTADKNKSAVSDVPVENKSSGGKAVCPVAGSSMPDMKQHMSKLGNRIDNGIIDPVCGKKVLVEESKRLEHNGKLFLFCSDKCREDFIKNPDKYITK